MGKVIILDENTANQIAAGEVIERPASVVKEMAENSLDAGATSIQVEIKNGGISYIRICDNGSGIDYDDTEVIFERHATSKIRSSVDLESISTLGFRGEALASIASVARVELTTKTEDSGTGTKVIIEGGTVKAVSQTGCPSGTTFVVRELFYNTPARYKFLKKDSTEAGYISNIITRLALAHPEVSFKLSSNGSQIIHTPGNNDLQSAIYSIYGKDMARNVLRMDSTEGGLRLYGFIGKPEMARGTRNQQSIFLNGRYIKSSLITSALEEAYKTSLMVKKFPFAVLHLSMNLETVDVNVHPSKMEVRFVDEKRLFSFIYHSVKNTLMEKPEIKKVVEEAAVTQERVDTQVKKEPAGTRSYIQRIIDTYKMPEKIFDRHESVKSTNPDRIICEGKAPGIQNKSYTDNKNMIVRPVQSKIEEEKQSPVEIIEHEEAEMNDTQKLLNATVIGQVFNTYIILEYDNDMFMIDQHAAHERIRYEELKKKIESKELFSQGLIAPVVVKLTHDEINYVKDQLELFEGLGFELEPFGPDTIIIRSVPDIFDKQFIDQDFTDILDRLTQTKKDGYNIISDETIFLMSCKGAIKANRKMSFMEIENLIHSLVLSENPFHCVHGRPVIISLSQKELEKRFKRIV